MSKKQFWRKQRGVFWLVLLYCRTFSISYPILNVD